jgi:hypothetical protein
MRAGVQVVDWKSVNSAIIARWGEAGFIRIKTFAWEYANQNANSLAD